MIEINNQTRTSIDEDVLARAAETVLEAENRKGAELSIALVGEQKSRELNRIYRGKNKVADVLSFQETELGLGEIVLTPAKIRQDARKYGITFIQYLVWMLVHGILHLLGYDHEQSKNEQMLMERKEQQYLRSLGIPRH